MRTQGIADLTDVRYAILEPNGKISFLKSSDTPGIATPIVIDTEPDMKSIKSLGYNPEWLYKQLDQRNTNLAEVFLMTVNESGDINIIRKDKKR